MAGDVTDNTNRHLGPQYTWNPTTVALTTTTAVNGTALDAGLYEIECTEDCFFLQVAAAGTAALTDVPLQAGVTKRLVVTAAANAYVAGILASGTADLTLTRIG